MLDRLRTWYTNRSFRRAHKLDEYEQRIEAARKAHKPVKHILEERRKRVTEALR